MRLFLLLLVDDCLFSLTPDIIVTVEATGGANGAVTGTKEDVECNNRGFCVQEIPESVWIRPNP